MKKKLSGILLALGVLLLTGCDAQEDISNTISNSIPNLYVTLAQLGAFIVMVLIVIFLGYKPIKKKLEARKKYVEDKIKDADSKVKDAELTKKQAEKEILNSKVEANKIIQEAKSTALESAKKITDDAQAEIEKVKKQNEEELAIKKAQLEKQAHNKIVSTAIETSKEILGREITKEDNDKLVDDFLDQLDKKDKEDE